MSFLMWSDRGTIPLIILFNFDIHFSAFLIRPTSSSPQNTVYTVCSILLLTSDSLQTVKLLLWRESVFQVQQSRTYSENLIGLMCILPGGL